jgi:hemin uptake protein HemP
MIQDTQTRKTAVPVDPPRPQAVDAEALFRGEQWVVIEYRGERYQLRRTRAGKLILTK